MNVFLLENVDKIKSFRRIFRKLCDGKWEGVERKF